MNEAIEHFPVGRRLAYDTASGRLWVVCRVCERWNLSPFESRWEAIEEAERAFRGTRVRVAGENISLARLRDGTELVRIGKALREELTVWRYGDQFGKRYRNALQIAGVPTLFGVGMLGLAGAAAFGLSPSINMVGGSIAISALHAVYTAGTSAYHSARANKFGAAMKTEAGASLRFNAVLARECAFVTGGLDFDWKLRIWGHRVKPSGFAGRAMGVKERAQHDGQRILLHGSDAERALAALLPLVNADGGSKGNIREATSMLIASASVQQLLQRASTTKPAYRRDYHVDDGISTLAMLPPNLRLALEMSLHEDDERRAMEGEMQLLEQRWKDADALASIADALLVPEAVQNQLNELKAGHAKKTDV